MIYIALLRGINVGTSQRISMKKLKEDFEGLGFVHVSTYINSGNIIFDSSKTHLETARCVEEMIRSEIGEKTKVLVKSKAQMTRIAGSIPDGWENDDHQKTDVAYLFDSANRKEIIDDLPINREFLEILFVDGALIWNVQRTDYHKSRLNKIAGHPLYQEMTVRNVITARNLAK